MRHEFDRNARYCLARVNDQRRSGARAEPCICVLPYIPVALCGHRVVARRNSVENKNAGRIGGDRKCARRRHPAATAAFHTPQYDLRFSQRLACGRHNLTSHASRRTGALLRLLTVLRLAAARATHPSDARPSTCSSAALLRNLRARRRTRLLRQQRQTAEQKNRYPGHNLYKQDECHAIWFPPCCSRVKVKAYVLPDASRSDYAHSAGAPMKEVIAAEGIKDSLRQRGVRLTRQRQILLDLIDKSGQHLDAERLYLLAKEQDPKLNRVTVYRTLKMLKAGGLVDELDLMHIGGDQHYYETRMKQEHAHIICLRCGKVEEFFGEPLQKLRKQVEAHFGFQVILARTEVGGYCSHCQTLRSHEMKEAESQAVEAERRTRAPRSS